MPSTPTAMPSPERIFDTLQAYQRTAALKAGIELDLFTTIADGADTAALRTVRGSLRHAPPFVGAGFTTFTLYPSASATAAAIFAGVVFAGSNATTACFFS